MQTAVAPESPPPRRREALREALREAHPDLDALLVTDLVNVRYLSGFTGSNGAVLVGADGTDLISTDGRYTVQVAEQAGDLPLVGARDVAGALVAAAVDAGARRIGVEADAMSVGQYDGLRADGAATLSPTSGMVESLRQVKDPGEVTAIAAACEVADRALAQLVTDGVIAPGRTEREVARALEWAMYSHGAAAIAFETIVATGANSAVPHHRPTDAILARGDFVKIDFGAVVDGYHSDMTRTYVLGTAQPWQREVYDLVAAAAQAGRAGAVAGASGA
ncbi:M24 family metallopeptidase, partial [Gordonia sp. (in: high G+C Gram-positive bacteria)]|uniref:M24 family metallopeptidase n=1 Tax=Gordonia sp. (in: high G+C Gram-positive bacteria) TaxID=84139 RepID=UPI0039E2BC38